MSFALKEQPEPGRNRMTPPAHNMGTVHITGGKEEIEAASKIWIILVSFLKVLQRSYLRSQAL